MAEIPDSVLEQLVAQMNELKNEVKSLKATSEVQNTPQQAEQYTGANEDHPVQEEGTPVITPEPGYNDIPTLLPVSGDLHRGFPSTAQLADEMSKLPSIQRGAPAGSHPTNPVPYLNQVSADTAHPNALDAAMAAMAELEALKADIAAAEQNKEE